MYKVIADVDGLIKLAKSGLLGNITKHIQIIISQQVYMEAVESGKERLYEDAYIIDSFVEKGDIQLVKSSAKEEGDLSVGELSSLRLYKKGTAPLILSDDRKFLNILERHGIPFIMPTDLIAVLAKHRKLDKQEAVKGLQKIKGFVRDDVYLAALNYIGGE